MPEDSLLVAEPRELVTGGKRVQTVGFCALSGTWRSKAENGRARVCSKGKLLSYLNPVVQEPVHDDSDAKRTVRVVDREDIRQLLLF